MTGGGIGEGLQGADVVITLVVGVVLLAGLAAARASSASAPG